MEGPLWCQVLQLFISGLERGMTEEDRATVLPDIIRWAITRAVRNKEWYTYMYMYIYMYNYVVCSCVCIYMYMYMYVYIPN